MSIGANTITAGTLTTVNSNSEFTYFYVFKRVSGGAFSSTTYVNLRSTATGNAVLRLAPDLFSLVDISQSVFTNTIDYSTRGGFLNDTTMILSVYKRGQSLYSRMIGGGKTSQFAQTFSRDNQIPTASTLQLFVGVPDSAGVFGFNGTLYEMMFFRDALTDQAIQQTEGYLAQKWGLVASLPPTHAYYSATA